MFYYALYEAFSGAMHIPECALRSVFRGCMGVN
jgi:hypothetical protein